MKRLILACIALASSQVFAGWLPSSRPLDRVYLIGLDGYNYVYYCDVYVSDINSTGDGVYYGRNCTLAGTYTGQYPANPDFPMFVNLVGHKTLVDRQCNFVKQSYSTIGRTSSVFDCRD